MNHLIKKRFWALMTLLLLAACNEDFLEVTPQGQVLPTSVQNFFDMMANSNLNLGVQNHILMADDVFFPDYEVAETNYTDRSSEIHSLRAYGWEDQLYPEEDANVDFDWRNMYHKIFVSNYVLANIDGADLELSTEEVRQYVKGWGHFQRALGHFTLVNLYAKHYDPATASTDLGIPLVFEASPTQEPMPRATVQEVYDQVEEDINLAVELLQNFPMGELPLLNYRPSKMAALALKARIHQYKAEWEASRDAAQASLDLIEEHSIIGMVPLAEHDGNPSLWPFVNNTNPEVLILETSSASGMFPVHMMTFLTEDLLSIISAEDTRLDVYTIPGTQGAYSGYVPFYNTSTSRTPSRVSTPTVPDVYLMLAEAHARLNNLGDAESHLSTLRSERIRNYTHTNSANADALLQEIINERRIEHMYTGLRWFDIKRLNVLGYDISITHPIINDDSTENITLSPGANRFVIQLPQLIIDEFDLPWIQND